MRKLFSLGLLILVLWSPLAGAQSKDAPSPLDARNSVGTILLAGLVGGVLGLSTLSFYEYPEDNIRNISFGAGIGVIAAAAYLTMSVATTPLPENQSLLQKPGFDWAPVVGPGQVGLLAGLRW